MMEQELLRALKERMLRDINATQSAPPINIYNALPTSLQEVMTAGGSNNPANQAKLSKEAADLGISADDLEYMVNISRRDVEEQTGINPQTGEPIFKKIGWDKKVHRFAVPKGEREEETNGLGSLMANPSGDFFEEKVKGKKKKAQQNPENSLF